MSGIRSHSDGFPKYCHRAAELDLWVECRLSCVSAGPIEEEISSGQPPANQFS